MRNTVGIKVAPHQGKEEEPCQAGHPSVYELRFARMSSWGNDIGPGTQDTRQIANELKAGARVHHDIHQCSGKRVSRENLPSVED